MSDDVTRCPGGQCPLRDDCYRFRAVAYGRYDALGTPPYDRATGACEHHLPLSRYEPTEADLRTRAYHLWQRRGAPEGNPELDWSAAREQFAAELAARLSPLR